MDRGIDGMEMKGWKGGCSCSFMDLRQTNISWFKGAPKSDSLVFFVSAKRSFKLLT